MPVTIFKNKLADAAARQVRSLGGIVALCSNRVIFERSGNTLSFQYNGRRLRFLYSWQLAFAPVPLKEIFKDGAYAALQVKGKTVIDIGASIGDSSIYFALNGARMVYGFETDRARYSAAKANLELNGIENCVLYNREFDIVQDGRLLSGSVMKIDCEGCEYGLVGRADLSGVEEIMLEFHRGEQDLVGRLYGHGFEVRILSGEGLHLGLMHAKRRH